MVLYIRILISVQVRAAEREAGGFIATYPKSKLIRSRAETLPTNSIKTNNDFFIVFNRQLIN